MFAPTDIHQIFRGLDGVERGFPHFQADALIHRFAAEHLMSVSLLGNPDFSPDLERLDGMDEIWVFCFRKPRPGWRLFGRFIQKDHFIGLDLRDRHELGSRSSYQFFATNAIAIWDRWIGKPPIRSNQLHDYLSGTVRDTDNAII